MLCSSRLTRFSVKIIGNLFHAPKEVRRSAAYPLTRSQSLGVSTVGSSEAIILVRQDLEASVTVQAVLAAKRLWRDKRKKAGKPYDSPNLCVRLVATTLTVGA